jgi:hypothetical protein
MSSSPNRRDIEFKAYEGDILRGWFYPPLTPKAPVIVMAHGVTPPFPFPYMNHIYSPPF